MLTSIEGTYVDGVVKLAEQPDAHSAPDGAKVIVTFLHTSAVDIRAHGISAPQAAELRERMATFAQDWDSPEMSAYDDYHAAAKARH